MVNDIGFLDTAGTVVFVHPQWAFRLCATAMMKTACALLRPGFTHKMAHENDPVTIPALV